MESSVPPLGRRPLDIILLVYFIFNLVAISYLFDIEQIIITDVSHFTYPAWPPRAIVDLGHWWGSAFDPLLNARPVWWRATIWIDAVVFGPYYAFAIYAFIRRRNWIRLPSIIYASVMLTNVTIILSEEIWGPHATPHLLNVIGANASWIIAPALLIWRMRKEPFPAEQRAGSNGRKAAPSVRPVGKPSAQTARRSSRKVARKRAV
jgi:hypothetical protein